MQPNTLYFGDNLRVLREHFPDESVDLVYLDPPFNSKRDYNMVFAGQATADDTAQVKAFEDTWSFDGAAEDFNHVITHHERLSRILEALKLAYAGDRNMLAMVGYLAVMAARLIELHRVLKPTGSLYLHCDPTASHYLKMVLDGVFGADNFRADITWRRFSSHNDARRSFAALTDNILFYSRSSEYSFTPQRVPHDQEYIRKQFRPEPGTGRLFRVNNLASPNPRPNLTFEYKGYPPPRNGWKFTRERLAELDRQGRIYFPPNPSGRLGLKYYLDEMEGPPIGNVWTDIQPLAGSHAERLGYPTQKPLALLERIIAASSNEGDLVLDPFCGCGTAVVAAQKLGRQWCGIDITSLATSTIKKRLLESFPEAFPTPASIPVIGFPADVHGAKELAADDRHNFQNWVLSLIPGARPKGDKPKKGADQGIDGVWLWQDGTGAAQRGIISVKSGHVKAGDVRDLVGTMNREGAAMGLFVTLEPATKPMRDEAALAGLYQQGGTTGSYPRIQIVTADDLLAGRLPKLPVGGAVAAFKEASKIAEAGQDSLPGVE